MNPTLVAVFFALALSTLAVPAGAQGACTTRCALVIGNSDYERADGKLDLTNPKNDALAMTALFEDLGFAVMGGAPLLDADLRTMQRAIIDFETFSDSAELAVVYYAGHGQSAVVSDGVGQSFLIPTDAQLADDDNLEIEALSLDWAVRKLEDNVDALVLFLDACRDFNISARTDGNGDFRGIGAPKISSATLVSYAAQIGNLAADGDGANSPYATALLNHLPSPGRSIRSVLGSVQAEVERATNGTQSPDSTDQLGEQEVFFAGRPGEDVGIAQTIGTSEDAPTLTYSQCAYRRELALAQSSVPLLDEVIARCGHFEEILTFAKAEMDALIREQVQTETAAPLEAGLGANAEQDAAALDGGAAAADAVTDAVSNAAAPASATPLAVCETGYLTSGGECLAGYGPAAQHLQEVILGFGCPIGGADGKFGPKSVTSVRHLLGIEMAQYSQGLTAERFVEVEAGLGDLGAVSNCGCASDETYLSRQGRCQNEAARREAIARFERENLPAMVWIPGGSFTMGSPSDEPGRDSDEGPQRRIELSGFHMSATEVTFAQWDACVRAGGCSHRPDDNGWGRGSRPVMRVSWNDAQEFVAWVNRNTNGGYRLPSEAQWEYAARAGTTTAYSTGGSISSSQANFGSNVGTTQPVGSYAPNAWGLYDMHGNVWEWTQDCWVGNLSSHPSNGGANRSGDCSRRVLRGGPWINRPRVLRSANRGRDPTSSRNFSYGFRLLKTY